MNACSHPWYNQDISPTLSEIAYPEELQPAYCWLCSVNRNAVRLSALLRTQSPPRPSLYSGALGTPAIIQSLEPFDLNPENEKRLSSSYNFQLLCRLGSHYDHYSY